LLAALNFHCCRDWPLGGRCFVPGREDIGLIAKMCFICAGTIIVVEDDRTTGEVIQLTLTEELSWHTL